MLSFYRFLTKHAEKPLKTLLQARTRRGKELPERLGERMGLPSRERPDGPLIWLHAASVGEVLSALILIDTFIRHYKDLNVLVTTGTISSARLMETKLPPGAFHQFYPLDHPHWTKRFLDYWRPDLVLWMESELWPNMLLDIRSRHIPAVLVNARLSDASFGAWRLCPGFAKSVLSCFSAILAQAERDRERFEALGAPAFVTDNLKYSARPLPCDKADLEALQARILGRPVWIYASTHKGEEDIACRVHESLKTSLPDLLTVIVPRHPERRGEIRALCEQSGLKFVLRGMEKNLPDPETDIYIADTMGELGLFYRLAAIACIGRSLSDDGGGGHNPIEAAQLGCAVLHGKNIQYQKDLFADMNECGAALRVEDEQKLGTALHDLFSQPDLLRDQQEKALAFAKSKERVIETVLQHLGPFLAKLDKPGAARAKVS